GVKGLENAFLQRRRHAATGVADGDVDGTLGAEGANLEIAALRHSVESVGPEVEQCLLDLVRVAQDEQSGIGFGDHAGIRRFDVFEQLTGLNNCRGDVHFHHRRAPVPADGKKPAGEVSTTAGGGPGVFQRIAHVVTRGQVLQGEVDIAQDESDLV